MRPDLLQHGVVGVAVDLTGVGSLVGPDPHEARLAPAGAPGVLALDVVQASGRIRAVAHRQDAVVDGGAAACRVVQHAVGVQLPDRAAGRHRDGHGADVQGRLHGRPGVGHLLHAGGLRLAVLQGGHGAADAVAGGGVWVGGRALQPVGGQVGAQHLGGPASVAAALVGVAVHDLLLRVAVGRGEAVLDRHGALDRPHGREGPARAAVALVLYRGHCRRLDLHRLYRIGQVRSGQVCICISMMCDLSLYRVGGPGPVDGTGGSDRGGGRPGGGGSGRGGGRPCSQECKEYYHTHTAAFKELVVAYVSTEIVSEVVDCSPPWEIQSEIRPWGPPLRDSPWDNHLRESLWETARKVQKWVRRRAPTRARRRVRMRVRSRVRMRVRKWARKKARTWALRRARSRRRTEASPWGRRPVAGPGRLRRRPRR